MFSATVMSFTRESSWWMMRIWRSSLSRTPRRRTSAPSISSVSLFLCRTQLQNNTTHNPRAMAPGVFQFMYSSIG